MEKDLTILSTRACYSKLYKFLIMTELNQNSKACLLKISGNKPLKYYTKIKVQLLGFSTVLQNSRGLIQ